MADALRCALEFCTRTHTILWLIRGGALALGVAILVLMWTRLGKTRLTHKCIVLSVFGHLLLFGYLLLEGTDKIVGAAGWLGREGAPGIVGEHPTLLVANVRAIDEGDDQKQVDGATKPWHVTPLRSAAVPISSGPERTKVDLSTPLERSVSRAAGMGLGTLDAQAEPLTPRSTPAQRTEPSPANHPGPAASEERIQAPLASKQAPSRISPSTISDIARERVPIVPVLERQAAESSGLWDHPLRRSADEPRPISAADRSLNAKATAARPADAGNPAAGDGALDDPATRPHPARKADGRTTSDGPPRLLAADAQRPEPERDPAPATSVGPTPQRPHEVPQAYEQRIGANRGSIVRQQGGSPDTEAAVKAALAWLAANQEAGGHWSAARHGATLDRTRSGADVPGDMQPGTGVTGLALLAFLGAGHTHQGEQYQDNVRRGLDYLLRVQAADGNLCGGAAEYAAMYCHGMATLALAEAYGMTGDAKLLPPLRRAVAYTLSAQNPHHGGWRYRRGDAWGDTSQFGWQVMALKAAELAGVEHPAASRQGMLRFLDHVSSGRHGGLACYLFGWQWDGRPIVDAATPTMTAEALFCRFLLGTTPDNPLCDEASAYLLNNLPGKGRTDLYYWYYGTLAMYQVQGPAWETWNRAVQSRILQLQERNGSWSTHDRWGGHGGRVFTTALATLTLEVYYRYAPAKR
jgi:hypothetical protein